MGLRAIALSIEFLLEDNQFRLPVIAPFNPALRIEDHSLPQGLCFHSICIIFIFFMSRRINVSRGDRYPKIRGIKRRLKALDRWANSFIDYFPAEHARSKYWNYKIPVLDILVSPPKTTRKIQSRCASSLITAANHLLEGRPAELADTKITALITYPDMFGSELCIFFDLIILIRFSIATTNISL